MSDFRFKQFSIKQDQCAMKVGTDGVLLGAWCQANNPFNILDIGTGTGLIALMCAQRFPMAKICAIEPERNAYFQAQENVKNSSFSKQIKLENESLLSFKTLQIFDLIVCNPPFYTEDTKALGTSRQQARSAEHLPLSEILTFATKHLSIDGFLNLILPISQLPELLTHNLHLTSITKVKGNVTAPFKRILVSLALKPPATHTETTLIIEEKRHEYTEAYRALTKDFYLKF